MTLLTDLGETDDRAIPFIAASDLIVIEANHDLHMLNSGPYPPHLKVRVQSSRGHLSNADCGTFLARAIGGGETRTVWLAHLSATNNRPTLAVQTVRQALSGSKVSHAVLALPRRESGPIWTPQFREAPEQLSLLG
jgi:phosphoribosyl 1,2-cyclic phosphodiesterase